MPLAHSIARKVTPTILAKVYCQWVRLCALAVPLKFAPLFELGIGTVLTLDFVNRTARPVGLRRHEQRLVPHLKVFEDLVPFLVHFLLLRLLLHAAISAVLLFLYAPLYPDQLPVRSFYRPPLLETLPEQRSAVNVL